MASSMPSGSQTSRRTLSSMGGSTMVSSTPFCRQNSARASSFSSAASFTENRLCAGVAASMAAAISAALARVPSSA